MKDMEISNLSDMFKLFSDNTRLRIICEILNNDSVYMIYVKN